MPGRSRFRNMQVNNAEGNPRETIKMKPFQMYAIAQESFD